MSAPCFHVGPYFKVTSARHTGTLGSGGGGEAVLLRSSDLRPGTLPKLFPSPPLVLNFTSSPFRTFCLCFTVGVVLATCQMLWTPAEQERRVYAAPFFPLGCVFLPSEESVLRLDGWPLSQMYCLGFGIELRFDTDLGGEFRKFARIYIFSP